MAYCVWSGEYEEVGGTIMCSEDQSRFCSMPPTPVPCDQGTYNYPECPTSCSWNINIRSSGSYSKHFAVSSMELNLPRRRGGLPSASGSVMAVMMRGIIL